MSSHWGDLHVIPDTESGIAAIEREQMTKPRPMEVQGPELYQPQSAPVKQEPVSAENFAIDPITLHTIKLVQHSRKLKAIIQAAQMQNENQSGEGQGNSFISVPSMPEYTGPLPRKRQYGSLPFLPPDPESDFVSGVGKPPPEIDGATNRKVLRKGVAAILAHAGFDICGESILETMTDLTNEYFCQFTSLLRGAVDNQLTNKMSAFPDAMQQVYHEMGIGSYTNIHEFYQNRVINYHNNLMRTCQELSEECERLKEPDYKCSTDFKLLKPKEEPLSDIQFPVSDETEEFIDPTQLLHLEGLPELEMVVGNNSASSLTNEEDTKWPHSIKSEPTDTKVNVLDSFDTDDNPSIPELPQTPNLGSEMGDSLQDPGSVVSDILSPPSISSRPPPKKKKKR